MSNYFTVLKLLIKNMLLPDKSKEVKRGKRIGVFVLLGVSYLFLAAFLVLVVLLLGSSFLRLGLVNEFITVIWAMASLVVLFFGIVGLLNYLYFSRDTEFFLSLPLKPSTIYLAKFTVVYITELAVAALMLVPALITTGVIINANAFFYIAGLIGMIFAPSLPLMLASVIAVPLMYIVSFFKNKGALSSIVLILLFALFFTAYFFTVSKMNSFIDGSQDPDIIVQNVQKGIRAAARILYPLLALAQLTTLTPVFGLSVGVSALVNSAIFFGSVAALLAVSVLITNFVYKRGAASQMENVKKKSTGKERFVSGSVLKSLVKKEWRELIRTPSFAYQCLSCVVMTPLLVAIFSFGGGIFGGGADADTTTLVAVGPASTAIMWFLSFGFTLMFGVGFNVASSTAITREGQNFYFSKQMPVPYRTQLLAKKIVCMLISVISCAVALIILTIATKDIINLFIGFIFCILYAYGFICFSVFFDLRKPKLDWSVPNEAVKQNFHMMVPYLLNLIVSVIFILAPIITLLFVESYAAALAIIWSVMFAVGIAVAVIFHFVLIKYADKFYDRLSI